MLYCYILHQPALKRLVSEYNEANDREVDDVSNALTSAQNWRNYMDCIVSLVSVERRGKESFRERVAEGRKKLTTVEPSASPCDLCATLEVWSTSGREYSRRTILPGYVLCHGWLSTTELITTLVSVLFRSFFVRSFPS